MAVPALEEPQLLSGLTGLLKTAELENPKLTGQLIEIETGMPAGDLFKILRKTDAVRVTRISATGKESDLSAGGKKRLVCT